MADHPTSHKPQNHHYQTSTAAGGGAVYGLGLIGALFYFIQRADSFSLVLLGILKSVVWPAYMVYKLFELLRP